MITAAILITLLIELINKLLFWLETLLCRCIDFIYQLFEIFAGLEYMSYEGEKTLFIDVFFKNPVISTIYIGMCMIGVAMAFGFAIMAVVKKMFDITGEKAKHTYGQIITSLVKSIVLMFSMTVIVSATILASSVLMQRIDYLFNYVDELMDPPTIVFTDTQRATMLRIMSKIGNYNLNPSPENRYNMNSCFNDIRGDLQLLEADRVFEYTYEGQETSWQYNLLQIYQSEDINQSVCLDSYNQNMFDAIMRCAELIKTDGLFVPIDSYTRLNYQFSDSGTLGRTIMLCGGMTCAKNSKYNSNGTLTDGLRKPFYTGSKDVYDWDVMIGYFKITIFKWDHAVVILTGWFTLWELVKIMINAIARVFNIILLYLTAPPFLAVMPLDDGAKFKEWTTAFIIQSLSLFGSFISVRLMIMFVPIVMSGSFIIVPTSTFGNYIAKLVVLIGIVTTAGKASGMISGILAGNAGMQSIMAGDVGSGLAEKGNALAKSALKTVGKGALKLGGKAISEGMDLTPQGREMKDKFKQMKDSVKDQGGFVRACQSGFDTNAKKQEREKADADAKNEGKERNENEFRESLLEKLDALGGGGGGQPQQQQPEEDDPTKKPPLGSKK